MRIKKIIIAFALATLSITACKKGTDKEEEISDINSPTTTTEKLYYFTSDGVYLNSNKISDLKPSAKAIIDDSGNVYDFNSKAVLKNGNPISTPNSISYIISCFYIDGSDIYAGGYEVQGVVGSNYITRPAYWKNGVKMPLDFDNLSDGLFIHEVTEIRKYNNEIYLCGVTKISNLAVPPYNVLWKNGKFDYTANYSQYYAYHKPITVNGKLISVTKSSDGLYYLNLINGSVGSDWFDVPTAFTFSSAEFKGIAYIVYTRIYKDVGYLGCRTGNLALSSKYLSLASCSYNGKDEYVCLTDLTNKQYNTVYKNGIKMILPAIFVNKNIYKVIAR